MTEPPEPRGIADLAPLARRKEQRAWYWYDWANSAYVTTIGTVLFGPYLITIAKNAAPDCGAPGCVEKVNVLGMHIAAGGLPSLLITIATLASAVFLPLVGAIADRSPRKKLHMATYAWIGSAAAACLYYVTGSNWQLGAVAILVGNIMLGCSLVVYDAILVDIAVEDERDRVSSRGWAMGYLGGGLLLAMNLGVVLLHDTLGISESFAVRISMLSAALWWAGFTVIPFIKLRNHAPVHTVAATGTLLQQSFGQLVSTLRGMRKYPMTLTFLLAYLFYNDGIQTVITTASIYGAEELDLGQSTLIATILLVQFVAFFGALLFGKLAERMGSRTVILGGLVMWMVVVTVALFLPAGKALPFMLLAVGIGIVMGGTQALSRSFFSLLIPRGREGEYFSLYQACERGTSWFGTLVVFLMFSLTGSYRPAVFALIIFFLLGTYFLAKVDAQSGIREAGNTPPVVI